MGQDQWAGSADRGVSMLSRRASFGVRTVGPLPEVGGDGPVVRTVRRLSAQGVFLASTVLGDDVLGRRARVWLLRRAGARLAPGAMLHGGTFITCPDRLVVGPDTFLSRSCYLDLEANLVLGARVTVGHGTSFITTRHQLGPAELRCGGFAGESITVGDGAWLGANVTVLPGVRIGSGAVVAAGAVVTADVPDNVMVAGVPAHAVRSLGPGRE